MVPELPQGDAIPAAGPLTGARAPGVVAPFAAYVHVPFCRVRCGYCDFNTYTATELGGGADQANYAVTAGLEIARAGRELRAAGYPERPLETVFFGGGTPTILPAAGLASILSSLRSEWGLAPGAEVTTEANPDSVDESYLATLAAAGFTRVSFGMQSAVPHVLQTLERTHDPERVPQVVRWAKAAGLQVSLDLIYGTPGESAADWLTSVEAAVACDPDHISAYALTVEAGTKLAAQVRRGEVALPDADDQADKYEAVDDALTAAGFQWYEISNWAKADHGEATMCRHNLAYWRGHDWWGIGPGAHSHLTALSSDNGSTDTGSAASDGEDGTQPRSLRWWNVKHPRTYAARLEAGESPAAGREWVGEDSRELEIIMLGIRLREGLPVAAIPAAKRPEVAALIASGLVDGARAVRGTLVLTRRGRLLADGIVERLT